MISWPQNEINTLKRLHKRGKTDFEIALAMGRTKSSVQWRRTKIGLSNNCLSSWPQWEIDELIKRQKEGETDTEIALGMGKTEPAVRHRRTKIGLPINKVPGAYLPWPQWESDELVRRQKEGETDTEIALGIGKPRGLIRHRRIQMGLPRNPSLTTGSIWLREDTTKVINLEKEGWSVTCMAKLFGRSRKSIQHHLHDHRSPSALRQALEDRAKKAKAPYGLDCAAMVKHHPNRVRRALQGLSVNNGVFDMAIRSKRAAA